ncbi:MAG: hypothetical protein KR126chlam3_01010, partial [Chlamydiae bacterium]|nr:hypothetical protein [Chlamydiota bacterium]
MRRQEGIVVVPGNGVKQWRRAQSTGVSLQTRGIRLYWTRLSRKKRNGRLATSREVRALIRKMAKANAWGAPRIHGELLKL